MSRANVRFSQHKNVLQSVKSGGGSANTFRGFLAYLDSKAPDWFIWENVDSVAQSSDEQASDKPVLASNLDVAIAEFTSRGYESQAYLLDAFDFGLPEVRKRIYAVGVKMSSDLLTFQQQPVSATFEKIAEHLRLMRRKAPNYWDILLTTDHAALQRERAWRGQSVSSPWDSGSLDIHRKEYRRLGLRWGALRLPAMIEASLDYSQLPAREKDCLKVTAVRYPEARAIDVSQSISRLPRSKTRDGVVHLETLLPNSKYYDLVLCRVLCGAEKMRAQGFPTERFPSLLEQSTPQLLHDLAGNAMAGTVVLAVLTAFLLAAPWTGQKLNQAATTDEADVQSAISALGLSCAAAADDDADDS